MSLNKITNNKAQNLAPLASRQFDGQGIANLSGFMLLLININEREQVVPTKAKKRAM